MMKVITWETILEWWGKMLRKNEKKNVVSNEEKPVQSTQRLKNFLYKRFDFRCGCPIGGYSLLEQYDSYLGAFQ